MVGYARLTIGAIARGRMGDQPPMLDSRQINRMIKIYDEQKNTVAEICKIYDISRPSFYNYLKRNRRNIHDTSSHAR
jgi:hypothetical protein